MLIQSECINIILNKIHLLLLKVKKKKKKKKKKRFERPTAAQLKG